MGPRLRDLYLRDCGIMELAPGAFNGQDQTLLLLDMSGNNLTQLPQGIFQNLHYLQTLSLRDNMIFNLNLQEAFNSMKQILFLDLGGPDNSVVSIPTLNQ